MTLQLLNLPAPVWIVAGVTFIATLWLIYPFVIFPFLLRIFSSGIQKRLAKTWFKVDHAPSPPRSIAVLFCAHNEAGVLREKLANLLACAEKSPVPVRIGVFLDGCTDASQAIVESFLPMVELTVSSVRSGKSCGMRTLAEKCQEDIIVFTDANVLFSPDLFKAVTRLFSADPLLGCVAGSTSFTNDTASPNTRIEGAYWRHEETLKQLESITGSCLCGTGAIFAIRRTLFVPPPNDIIDDFHTTLNILFQRRRVIQSDALLVYERAATKPRDEWKRKVRIACRAYNCYLLLGEKIARLPIPLRIIFFSHKWLRWFSAIPLTIGLGGFLALIFLLSPALGAAAALLVAMFLLLGLTGMRPFAEFLGMFRACYATLWGVFLAFRGEKIATWTPVQSSRE